MSNQQGDVNNQLQKIEDLQKLLQQYEAPHYSTEEYRPFANDPDRVFKRKAPSIKSKRQIRAVQFDSIITDEARRESIAQMYGWDVSQSKQLNFDETYRQLAQAVFVNMPDISNDELDNLDDVEVKRAVDDFLSYTGARKSQD